MPNETIYFAKLPSMRSASISKIRLTKTTAATKMKVGLRNPFFRLGDNSPQFKAVFFCLPLLDKLKFELVNSIMVELFEQPLWLVSPSRDIANSLNSATQCLATLRDGFTHFRLGITT